MSDGTTLRVSEISGGGVPVVLSHALASSAEDLAPLAQEFAARGHRVVSFDQRGHGDSGPAGHVTVERLAQDILDVIEDQGARGAIVVGHSSGGYALLGLGFRASEFLSRIVVVGTTLQLTSAMEKLTMRYAKSPMMARLQRAKPAGTAIVRLGSFGRNPDRRAVEQVWSSAVRCALPTRIAYVDAMLDTPNLLARVREIEVPVVVVRGGHDRVVSRRRAAELAGVASDGRHVEVPGAGHMLPLEDPRAVVDAALA